MRGRKRQPFCVRGLEDNLRPDMADNSSAAAKSSGAMSTAVTWPSLRATFRADHPVPVATSRILSPAPALRRWAARASASEMAKLTSS